MSRDEIMVLLRRELDQALAKAKGLFALATLRGDAPGADADRLRAERQKGKAEGLAVAVRLLERL